MPKIRSPKYLEFRSLLNATTFYVQSHDRELLENARNFFVGNWTTTIEYSQIQEYTGFDLFISYKFWMERPVRAITILSRLEILLDMYPMLNLELTVVDEHTIDIWLSGDYR